MIQANIHSNEGWDSFIKGMHAAFETSPAELLAIGAAVGIALVLFANYKIARRLARMMSR